MPGILPTDPGVTADFLTALSGYTWSDNHLLTASGATAALAIVPGGGFTAGTWTVSSLGSIHLSRNTLALLTAGGTVNADGSFTWGGGSRYALEKYVDPDGLTWARQRSL